MESGQRRGDVMDYILERGSAQIEDLMAVFRVSRMTIHRDLDALERHGVIRKVWGGATAAPSGLFESNYRFRIGTATAEKRALAAAALEHVEPGQSVMLDDSTTVAFLAERLAPFRPLTVVTNALAVLERLSESEEISVIMLGGRYLNNFRSFVGLSCEQAVGQLHASVLFCSVSAISGTTAYHQDEQVVKVKRAMMAAADRRILLVDHRKFGRTALNHIADLTDFDEVITTDGIDAADLEAARDGGARVAVARRRPRQVSRPQRTGRR